MAPILFLIWLIRSPSEEALAAFVMSLIAVASLYVFKRHVDLMLSVVFVIGTLALVLWIITRTQPSAANLAGTTPGTGSPTPGTSTPVQTATPTLVPLLAGVPAETASDMILSTSQSWRRGWTELLLESGGPAAEDARYYLAVFQVTNWDRDYHAIDFSTRNFSASDEDGRQLPVGILYSGVLKIDCLEETLGLDPGEIQTLQFRYLPCRETSTVHTLAFWIGEEIGRDYSITITARGIGSISLARWRVQVLR